MKNILLLLMILIFPSMGYAVQCTVDCGTTCSVSSVLSAISAAGAGGTVNVPSGSCTWSTAVTITRGVTLVGGVGAGDTIITLGAEPVEHYLIGYIPNATAISNNEKFEISGFDFRNTAYTHSNGFVYVENSSATPITNIIVHDNKFKSDDSGYELFGVSGFVYGVAYHNDFDSWYSLNFLGYGSSLTEVSRHWCVSNGVSLDYDYGDGNNFYIEDNYFHTSENYTNGANWLEQGQGGRYCVRYNTFDYANYTTGIAAFDIHGNQGEYGGRGGEVYGNKFTNCNGNGGYEWIDLRGGELLMFYNQTSGTANLSIAMDEEHSDTATSSDNCTTNNAYTGGYYCGCIQHINNTYVWMNYLNTTIEDAAEDTDCCNAIAEDSEFFNYNASCTASSCSSGVGCGLDIPTGTCTTGTSYWKTSQNCNSSISSYVGKDVPTPISGTLYKCTSTNNWEAYYTPYDYPHPLQGATTTAITGVSVR